jgi:hypothetical protein
VLFLETMTTLTINGRRTSVSVVTGLPPALLL